MTCKANSTTCGKVGDICRSRKAEKACCEGFSCVQTSDPFSFVCEQVAALSPASCGKLGDVCRNGTHIRSCCDSFEGSNVTCLNSSDPLIAVCEPWADFIPTSCVMPDTFPCCGDFGGPLGCMTGECSACRHGEFCCNGAHYGHSCCTWPETCITCGDAGNFNACLPPDTKQCGSMCTPCTGDTPKCCDAGPSGSGQSVCCRANETCAKDDSGQMSCGD